MRIFLNDSGGRSTSGEGSASGNDSQLYDGGYDTQPSVTHYAEKGAQAEAVRNIYSHLYGGHYHCRIWL